jgi:disintegrin and metalloproteinase domain-containing protein 17
MIIYKVSDVKLSWEHYQNGEGHTHGAPKTCGYIREGKEANSEEILNENELQIIENKNCNRTRRQTETYEYTPTKTRCPLLLVADYRFYQEMGASSTKTTINYLVIFI